jgi:UDP-2-acetamido-3-amino-2,3-dideoxy-glucuronate N-acetyltransferase
MVFTNVINPRSAVPRKDEFMKTLVREGASLGANCTIVCGNTIGAHAFIGAGAVVTTDVPDQALVVGVPGRIVGWMCRCGVRLDFAAEGSPATPEAAGDKAAGPAVARSGAAMSGNATCPECGARYSLSDGVISQLTPGNS